MHKPEILDPPGKGRVWQPAAARLQPVHAVRQGRRFELTADGPVTQEHLDAAAQAAEKLLSTPVIEDVVSVTAVEEA